MGEKKIKSIGCGPCHFGKARGYWIARSSRAMTGRECCKSHPLPAQFPAAGNLAAKFFWIACHRDDLRRIGTAASKGCGKFPAPEGQRIRRAGAGKRFEAGREFARSGRPSATAP